MATTAQLARSLFLSSPSTNGTPSLSIQSHRRRVVSKRVSLAVRAEVEYLSLPEAKEGVKEGKLTVVDVRDDRQFNKAHIKGSKHVPLFIENTDTDIATAIKRQAHNNFAGNLYGLAFTKPNPEFESTLQKLIPDKSAKLLLVCQEGLRSSTAADKADALGYSNVAVLTRGLNKVPPGAFEKEGPKELQEAGKGGFVSIQTQFSIILGSILLTLLAIVSFFPDFAEQFLP